MKKTISICLFAALALGGALFAAWTIRTPTSPDIEQISTEIPLDAEPTEVTEQWDVAESMALKDNVRYVIGEQDGFLVVFESDGSTIYLETNIRLEHLSAETQEAVKNRIYIRDDKELYDFLESYSS